MESLAALLLQRLLQQQQQQQEERAALDTLEREWVRNTLSRQRSDMLAQQAQHRQAVEDLSQLLVRGAGGRDVGRRGVESPKQTADEYFIGDDDSAWSAFVTTEASAKGTALAVEVQRGLKRGDGDTWRQTEHEALDESVASLGLAAGDDATPMALEGEMAAAPWPASASVKTEGALAVGLESASASTAKDGERTTWSAFVMTEASAKGTALAVEVQRGLKLGDGDTWRQTEHEALGESVASLGPAAGDDATSMALEGEMAAAPRPASASVKTEGALAVGLESASASTAKDGERTTGTGAGGMQDGHQRKCPSGDLRDEAALLSDGRDGVQPLDADNTAIDSGGYDQNEEDSQSSGQPGLGGHQGCDWASSGTLPPGGAPEKDAHGESGPLHADGQQLECPSGYSRNEAIRALGDAAALVGDTAHDDDGNVSHSTESAADLDKVSATMDEVHGGMAPSVSDLAMSEERTTSGSEEGGGGHEVAAPGGTGARRSTCSAQKESTRRDYNIQKESTRSDYNTQKESTSADREAGDTTDGGGKGNGAASQSDCASNCDSTGPGLETEQQLRKQVLSGQGSSPCASEHVVDGDMVAVRRREVALCGGRRSSEAPCLRKARLLGPQVEYEVQQLMQAVDESFVAKGLFMADECTMQPELANLIGRIQQLTDPAVVDVEASNTIDAVAVKKRAGRRARKQPRK